MLISVSSASNILKSGGIVAFPTETVYGLGADATNKKAVQKIFIAKNRPTDNPLICHFYSVNQIQQFTPFIPPALKILINNFTPGPVSFLLPLLPHSSLQAATAGASKVIVRIPNHPLALQLIDQLGSPIAAPSANTSGKTSGTNPFMIEQDLGDKIDGIIDGGCSEVGLESTILDCTDFFENAEFSLDQAKKTELRILRPGAIGKVELEDIILKHNLNIEITELSEKKDINLDIEKMTTPGAKYPHYSPQTPVYKWELLYGKQAKNCNFAVLFVEENRLEVETELKKIELNNSSNNQIKLISLGSLKNMPLLTKNLYKNLISLDDYEVDSAFFYPTIWPVNSSLGKAVANRLLKVVQI